MSFSSLGLIDPLLRALEALEYRQPTPVQSQAIPAILAGRDLMAAAQTGTHPAPHSPDRKPRQGYGHSLAVAPWGEVLADAGTEPGVTLVDLDMARVNDARTRVPAWRHDPVVWGP